MFVFVGNDKIGNGTRINVLDALREGPDFDGVDLGKTAACDRVVTQQFFLIYFCANYSRPTRYITLQHPVPGVGEWYIQEVDLIFEDLTTSKTLFSPYSIF